MANKKRLIDAKALEKQIKQAFEDTNPYAMGMMLRWIRKQTTVDAVEVVRCKDCSGWCRNIGIKDSPNGHCFTHDIDTNGHDYCSYGERKDNE